jgi:hypothetical protein
MTSSDDFERSFQLWRRWVRNPLERAGSVLHGGLIVGGLLFFGLLGIAPQGRELFRLVLEQPYHQHTAFAIVSIGLLSVMLFFTYEYLFPIEEDDVEADSGAISVVAKLGLYGIAILPWLTCFISIHWMAKELQDAKQALGKLSMPPFQEAQDAKAAAISLIDAILGNTVWAYVTIGVCAVGIVLLLMRVRRRAARYRRVPYSGAVFSTALVLVLAGAVYPAASGVAWHELYAYLGPIATVALAALQIFTLVFLFVLIVRLCGLWNSVGAVLAALLVVGSGFWLTRTKPSDKVTDAGQKQESRRGAAASTADCGEGKRACFADAAKAWTAAKPNRPTLVISAQGGGMYAAAEAALVLSRLQDTKPEFYQHIFAISAVSGGSIGTAIYRSALTSCVESREARCVETKADRLLKTPHLSAIVGNLPADILRRICFLCPDADRSDAFKSSLVRTAGLQTDNPYNEDYKPYQPAFLFNTTWMSNAYRVAFAPFSLRSVGDGTLWSFNEAAEDSLTRDQNKFEGTFADAVVASARFPGILPPLALQTKNGKRNFGDGGYADASGVTTAYEVLTRFNQVVAESPTPFNARLLMLTSDYKPVTPESTEDETDLIETRAPIEALLGLRSDLARKAIQRAETELKQNYKAKPGEAGSPYFRISLDFEAYRIALGFQLSNTSHSILSLLIGRPEWCEYKVIPPLSADAKDTIINNSCMLRRVKEYVGGASKSAAADQTGQAR